MTMVLEGDASYFGLDGASTYGVQLEDVVSCPRLPRASLLAVFQHLLACPVGF